MPDADVFGAIVDGEIDVAVQAANVVTSPCVLRGGNGTATLKGVSNSTSSAIETKSCSILFGVRCRLPSSTPAAARLNALDTDEEDALRLLIATLRLFCK